MSKTPSPSVSFLIPCLNEQECIPTVIKRVCATAEKYAPDYEIVFVDDGSTDGTLNLVKTHRTGNARIRLVSFSRNFGHQVAITAGLTYVTKECAVILDADLQDPPELLPQLIEKWRDGYKVVYGIRRSRQCSMLKVLCYKAFYYLLNKWSDIDIPRDAGDFCLMDRQVIDVINTLQEYKPFVRGMRAWVGFPQTHVVYDRPDRLAGQSSYSWLHLFKLALDGFLSFTDVFLLWASIFSFGIAFLSVLFSFWLMGNHVLFSSELNTPFGNFPVWTGVICLITFLIGLIFIYLGLIGKYVGRIFMHTKQRPLYIVKETCGFEN